VWTARTRRVCVKERIEIKHFESPPTLKTSQDSAQNLRWRTRYIKECLE
jgi:hypothetical protein